MASQQASGTGSYPTAQVVGNAFVHQYYHILCHSPDLVYRFYQETSKLGRPEPQGVMTSITTMQAINEKILSQDYSEFRAEIKTVDAQDSLNGGVLVLVTGYLIGRDNVRRNFTQSFFLAPQDKGYFVLNDIFRFVEEIEQLECNHVSVNGTNESVPGVPLTPDQEPAPAEETHVVDQATWVSAEEPNAEEVYDHSDNDEGSVVEEEVPVDEVVDEIPNESQVVPDSTSPVQEELPKKSYASIVKVKKESSGPSSVPTLALSRPTPANLERQGAPTSLAPAPAAEAATSGSIPIESGNLQELEADGHSIYIKSLPLTATEALLEEEFKKFGPIKSGGIQVRSNKQQGFCFGFVEFESASAVQRAIEASPIMIGGRQAYVEEKRPSSTRVNNRGRFLPGRGGGGFRNDGVRGRGGNYGGGRGGYGQGDFNSRMEFGNRGNGGRGGGPSGRGGAEGGYQRVDHQMGNNGGRVNRTSALAVVSASPNTVAPRVPATA